MFRKEVEDVGCVTLGSIVEGLGSWRGLGSVIKKGEILQIKSKIFLRIES